MTDMAWQRMAGRLLWLIAIALVVATVIDTLVFFDITVSPPADPGLDADFLDRVLAGFARDQAAWVQNLVSSVLYAVGFAAIAALGIVLRGVLDRDDPRTAVMAITFVLAGAIGVVSQLLSIGATEAATNPEYCDCGYLAEEVMSRLIALHIVDQITFWMTGAVILLTSIGLLALAAAAAASWPSALVTFTRLVAVVGLLSVAWIYVAVPLLLEAGYEGIDYFLVGFAIVAVVGGILLPAWAIWTARTLRRADDAPPEASPLA